MPISRVIASAALLAGVCSGLAQSESSNKQTGGTRPSKPNILIITIDTLRADRLGCYGYDRPTSPNLDAFSKSAALFTNCHSTSSFTPPSHASIFTSQYVCTHGLRTWNKLPDEAVTLAETLRDSGYRTGASVNLVLLTRNNLGQGFDWQREELRDGRVVINNALQLVREPGDRPFFIWLHFYDVHRPYGRTPNWTRKFNPTGRAGVGDTEQHYNLKPEGVKKHKLVEEDLQFIADRYDAGLAYLDSQLGPLFEELSSPQRLADTMIVVTSDHGENLLEGRERIFTHDFYLYDVVSHIPLMIRFPAGKFAGQECDQLVSLIDIAPTVLETAGIERPAVYQGLSLVPALGGKELPRTEIFSETWGVATLKAAHSRDRLVVRDYKHDQVEYFDLAADPHKERPDMKTPDEAAAKLEARLAEFAKACGTDTDAPALDAETQRILRANGYLGDDGEENSSRKRFNSFCRKCRQGRVHAGPQSGIGDGAATGAGAARTVAPSGGE